MPKPKDRPRIVLAQFDAFPDELKSPARTNGQFKNNQGSLPLDRAIRDLEYELGMMKVATVQLATGLDSRYCRRDGWPQAQAPGHPGVVVTYTHPTFGVMRLGTDRFFHWVDNLWGVIRTLEGLRMMERYGTTGNGKQYEGFRQLPSSTGAVMDVQRAAEIVKEHGKSKLSVEVILREREVADMVSTAARYATHPDRNPGKADATEVFQLVEQARQALSAHHGGL